MADGSAPTPTNWSRTRLLGVVAYGGVCAHRADVWQVRRLTGDRKGTYAVAISGRYRVVFCFEDGDAYDVDVVHHHKS